MNADLVTFDFGINFDETFDFDEVLDFGVNSVPDVPVVVEEDVVKKEVQVAVEKVVPNEVPVVVEKVVPDPVPVEKVPEIFMSEEDINTYINGQKAKTTKYKDTTSLNAFNRFCSMINESRDITEIPVRELDNILCQFFINAKTIKGQLYEPDSLTGIRNGLQRVLEERGSKHNIREDPDFGKSRRVLASRRKELTKQGKGNKPNATRPLSTEEVQQLYKAGYFGGSSPVVLQRTVWWIITQHFGQRARDEGRQMCFGDVGIEKDLASETEYLVWYTERSTKTRNGERPMGHKRIINPKAFATGDNQCPVDIFRKFISHRPLSMRKSESPLFLQVRHNIDFHLERIWYYEKPMGKNSIGNFMKGARDILPKTRGKVANHSARKTSLTNLLGANINPLHVQQISGHKKLESLNTYNQATLQQQKQMSDIIAGKQNRPLCTSNSSSGLLSSTSENVIPVAVEFKQNVLHPSTWNQVTPLFRGATITNCTFNINTVPAINSPSPVRKRKRIIIEDSQE